MPAGSTSLWSTTIPSDATLARAGAAPNLRLIRLEAKARGLVRQIVGAAIRASRTAGAPLVLFTDADIVHDPRHLSALVAQLLAAHLDLVSEMVRLNCASLAERALVPAFVYFFQMLYPFAKVNDPRSAVAAAAGGTVLIRREMLERIGGIAAIKGALIDDVALARAVKPIGTIYLGHTALAASIRRYPAFVDIWQMISRTAFTQLRYSAALLLLTLAGLALVWLVPPGAALLLRGWGRLAGLAACTLAAASFLPTLSRYRRSYFWAMALPLIALFYMAATLRSALEFLAWSRRPLEEPRLSALVAGGRRGRRRQRFERLRLDGKAG